MSAQTPSSGWVISFPDREKARLEAEMNPGAKPKLYGAPLVASKLDELTLAVERLSDGVFQILDLLVAQSASDQPRPVVDVPSHDSSLSVDLVSPTVEGTPGGVAEQSAPQTTK